MCEACKEHTLEYFLEYYPEELALVMWQTEQEIGELYDELYDGEDVDLWETAMKNVLTRFIVASFMIGAGLAVLSAVNFVTLINMLDNQFSYLENFKSVIQTRRTNYNNLPISLQSLSKNPLDSMRYRALMYAKSVTESYWKGKLNEDILLPAYPGEGSQCLSNCRCSWRKEIIDAENGDFDYYWELDLVENCQTCIERNKCWYPLQVRGWQIIIKDLE